MGTNVSANLFTAAPAAPQGNVNVQKNVNKAFEGRKATSGKQGKDFSSELKDVTKEDKLTELTKEAVETPVADKPVQKADTAEAKPEGDVKGAVAEVVDEAAEEMAAEATATTVVPMPLAELTSSMPAAQTEENVQPILEQPVAEQPIQTVVDTATPEISTAAQELQQPAAATQLQQQTETTNVQVQDAAKEAVVVDGQVVAEPEGQATQQTQQNAEVQQPQMHQPKSIEALLKPVQPVEAVTAPDGSQVINSGDMTKEQHMLAVLSGSRIVSQDTEPATNTATQKTTVEDMNNLLGQQTQVVNTSEPKQSLNPDSQQSQQSFQQPQQNFQQNMENEAAAPVVQAQQAEAEEATVNNRMDATQAINSSVQTQTTDNVAQTNSQPNVAQTRDTYQVTQQIVEQARLLRNAENTEMVIKLNPRHLGDLTLKVAVNSNGGVTATFHTDNAQVRAMLETSMIQLQKELNEQGIKVDSVEVQTGLSDGQLPEGQSQGYYQQQQQQNVRSQEIDLKDFEEDVENLAAGPVNQATEVIRDSEGNKISDGVDYAV
ncbi:Flagellar hook-length control protein FliK [Anaerovibrio sp. JC8]|uniref:flagellar hook-length control protein FliK n=1 Tax=Anaerovibrio sp. JC8 TaxID=1240085 RepID=UPI000A0CEB80|nr:flagellar hook-length control protein FliK [Anaerovibrio sp. JC8]ORU00401.1 Flagellar hook-length control protein FliK [Anaerovibrio sp. JC8]